MKVKVKSLSRVRLFATTWTVAYQAPPSMGFSRQECWSGSPFPSPGDLPDPGIEPRSPASQTDCGPSQKVREKVLKYGMVSSYELGNFIAFPCSSGGKASACNAEDMGSIPGSGRSPGEGNGNPL